MAKYALLNLPPSLRIQSEAAQGRRTVPLDVGRVSIIGFADDSYQLAKAELPVWPVPLLQVDCTPQFAVRQSAHFYTIGYNSTTKLLGSEIVKNQWNSYATFEDAIHGRAGKIYNKALDAGIPTYVHDKNVYLFSDGPTAYDQSAFDHAVKTVIDHSALEVELVR